MGITVIVLIECTFTPQFFIGAIEAFNPWRFVFKLPFP